MEALCQKQFLQLAPPTEADPRAEKQRILDALSPALGSVRMALPVMRKLHAVLRDAQWHALVTLQRPLPVIITLRAGRALRSSSSTLLPLRAAAPAAIRPAAPAPTTIRSLFIFAGFLHFLVYLVFLPDLLKFIEIL